MPERPRRHRKDGGEMGIVAVKMPEPLLEGLDELVRMKRYGSRSEAIREAVRELLRRELW